MKIKAQDIQDIELFNDSNSNQILLFNNSDSNQFFSVIKESEYETIAIVDFLNLIRKCASNSSEAKFLTVEEFGRYITTIAHQLESYGDFSKIYLVSKWFSVTDQFTCNEIPKIIMWNFCQAVPKWKDNTILVLVNGLNDKDNESDDRALFVLYNEFTKTTGNECLIFSNDNFESIESHFLRKITLNFYYVDDMTDGWKSSKIRSGAKTSYEQNKNLEKKSYAVIRTEDNTRISVTI